MFPKFHLIHQILAILIIFLIIPDIYCGEDYYKLLGVKRSASKSEIRRAFTRIKIRTIRKKQKPSLSKLQMLMRF